MRPFSLIYLEKENNLNKILKQQKKSGQNILLLYTSLWDAPSQKLLKKLEKKWGKEGGDGERVPIYVINSFTMPHSFVIYKTTHLPHLISLQRRTVTSEDYLPQVYHKLCV